MCGWAATSTYYIHFNFTLQINQTKLRNIIFSCGKKMFLLYIHQQGKFQKSISATTSYMKKVTVRNRIKWLRIAVVLLQETSVTCKKD